MPVAGDQDVGRGLRNKGLVGVLGVWQRAIDVPEQQEERGRTEHQQRGRPDAHGAPHHHMASGRRGGVCTRHVVVVPRWRHRAFVGQLSAAAAMAEPLLG
jgi:hypothetical protein